MSDDQSTFSFVGFIIWATIIFMAVMAICTVGAFVGAYYSIKNYVLSFHAFVHLRDPETLPEGAETA